MPHKDDRDNRSNQLNPNNSAYWSSRRSASSDEDDDTDGNTPAGMIDRNYIETSSKPSPANDTPEPVYRFPSWEHLALHYVTNAGRLGGMVIQAESFAQIVAACEDLWGSNRFLYLRGLFREQTYFLRERELESEDIKLRSKVSAALQEARAFPKPADSFVPIHVLSLPVNTLVRTVPELKSFQF